MRFEVREGPCPAFDAAAVDLCDLGRDDASLETDTRHWAMPGILRQLDSERYIETYLPALVEHAVHDLRPRYRGDGTSYVSGGFEVRFPEGPRGRMAKFTTRIMCLRSPSAAAPCEGPELDPTSRGYQESRAGARGHRWAQGYAGSVYCARCRCSGEIVPLTWIETRYTVPQSRGSGDVTCIAGDAATRALLLRTILETPPPSRDTFRIDVTPPSQRRAIRERALSPFDAGRRWLLPQDVTPETAPADETPLWVDLGARFVEIAGEFGLDADALEVWRGWLAGGTESPPHVLWGRLWWEGLRAWLDTRLAGDGPPVYIDARSIVTALARTGVDGWRMQEHPAAMFVGELRSMHDSRPRHDRPSVLLLLPEPSPEDRPIHLDVVRRVWASGR